MKTTKVSMREIIAKRAKQSERAASSMGLAKPALRSKSSPQTELQVEAAKYGTLLMSCVPGSKSYNQNLGCLMKIYDAKRKSEFMTANEANYDTRFQAMVTKPNPPANQMTVAETEILLGNLFKARRNLTDFGFAKNYEYAAPIPQPSQELYTDLCLNLPREYASEFNQFLHKVAMPPTMPNMLATVAQFGKKEKRKLASDWKESLKVNWKFLVLDTEHQDWMKKIQTAKLKFDQAGYKAAVALIMQFVSHCDLPTSSPAFPFNCLTKEDGHSWGHISETNTPLLHQIHQSATDIMNLLAGYMLKIKAEHLPWPQFLSKVDAWYKKIISQTPCSILNPGGMKIKLDHAWPHFIFEQSGGNYKHSTQEDILNGKPDRSIYMTPAVMRYLMMYLFQIIQESFTHPTRLKNFGWSDGGAEKLLSSLVSQLPTGTDVDFDAYEAAQPCQFGGPLKNVQFDNVLFCAQDIKKMDFHSLPEKNDELHRDIQEQLGFAHCRNPASLLVRVMIALSCCMTKSPMILSNQGIFYQAKDLNPSGVWLTYLLNQYGSAAMMTELIEAGRNLPHSEFIGGAEKCSGDDQLMMWVFKKSPYIKQKEQAERSEKEFVTDTSKARQELEKTLRTRMIKIAHRHGYEFKEDTLVFSPNFSSMSFLGAHVYLNKEHDLIPSRAPSQIMATLVLPKSIPEKLQDVRALTAARIYSTYYESVLSHPKLAKTMEISYPRIVKSVMNRKVQVLSGFWSQDGMEITNILPSSLPTVAEVYEWMTGNKLAESSEGGVPSEEFGEALSDADEEAVPPRRRSRGKKVPEVVIDDEDLFAALEAEDESSAESQLGESDLEEPEPEQPLRLQTAEEADKKTDIVLALKEAIRAKDVVNVDILFKLLKALPGGQNALEDVIDEMAEDIAEMQYHHRLAHDPHFQKDKKKKKGVESEPQNPQKPVQINGNQGSATNSDDHADRHYDSDEDDDYQANEYQAYFGYMNMQYTNFRPAILATTLASETLPYLPIWADTYLVSSDTFEEVEKELSKIYDDRRLPGLTLPIRRSQDQALAVLHGWKRALLK